MSRIGTTPADTDMSCQYTTEIARTHIHTTDSPTLEQLREYNGCWIETQKSMKKTSSSAQNVFWLGCTCASVPPNILTLTVPGAIISHRNFGNLFLDSDTSIQAAIHQAITDNPGIKFFVVAHDDCIAIKLAIDAATGSWDKKYDKIKPWIEPLIVLAQDNPGVAPERLAELSASQQSANMTDYIIKTYHSLSTLISYSTESPASASNTFNVGYASCSPTGLLR